MYTISSTPQLPSSQNLNHLKPDRCLEKMDCNSLPKSNFQDAVDIQAHKGWSDMQQFRFAMSIVFANLYINHPNLLKSLYKAVPLNFDKNWITWHTHQSSVSQLKNAKPLTHFIEKQNAYIQAIKESPKKALTKLIDYMKLFNLGKTTKKEQNVLYNQLNQLADKLLNETATGLITQYKKADKNLTKILKIGHNNPNLKQAIFQLLDEILSTPVVWNKKKQTPLILDAQQIKPKLIPILCNTHMVEQVPNALEITDDDNLNCIEYLYKSNPKYIFNKNKIEEFETLLAALPQESSQKLLAKNPRLQSILHWSKFSKTH